MWVNWGCFWCSVSVHCEASEWSPWSPCTKKGKTCGFKRGTETRVREIIQHPSAKGNLCPPTSEARKCTVQRKKCPKGERGTVILTTCAQLDPQDLMQISRFLRKRSVWSKLCTKQYVGCKVQNLEVVILKNGAWYQNFTHKCAKWILVKELPYNVSMSVSSFGATIFPITHFPSMWQTHEKPQKCKI